MKCECGNEKRLTLRNDGRERWRCSHCTWLRHKEKHNISSRGRGRLRIPLSQMANPSGAKWDRTNPEKRMAHRRVEAALIKGELIRQPCEVCSAKAHAHHDDYTKPLDVRWLCPRHHSEHHKKLGAFQKKGTHS